jgi:hypothetical protein
MKATQHHIDIDAGRDWDEPFWELTDVDPDSTGLPFWVFVCVKFPHMRHDAVLRVAKRRKIPKAGLWVGITIPARGKPKVVTPLPAGITDSDIELACAWIVLNRKALRDHWFGRNDSAELCRNVQRLDRAAMTERATKVHKVIDDASGLIPVTIPLDKGVLLALKRFAKEDGVDQESLMRQVLVEYARKKKQKSKTSTKAGKKTKNSLRGKTF